MKILNHLKIELNINEFPSYEQLSKFKTELSCGGFSMTFDGEPNFKLFWDSLENYKTFDFKADYLEIKNQIKELITKKGLEQFGKKCGVLPSTLNNLIIDNEIRDASLIKILNAYNFKVDCKAQDYSKYDNLKIILDDLNFIARKNNELSAYQIAKVNGLNYIQVNQFINGSNLSLEQLSKLIKFSIKI